MQSGFDIHKLRQEAHIRWLKPPEVLFILQNHDSFQFTHAAPKTPPNGALFLFNRRVLRFFRKDGYEWRKKRDGKTISEAHEQLKVGNAIALNCYYAHGEPPNPYMQRRVYWMLDPALQHIVLAHYREVTEGICISGNITTPNTSQELLAFNHVEDVQTQDSIVQSLSVDNYGENNQVGDVQKQGGYSGVQVLDFPGGSETHQKQFISLASTFGSNENEPSWKDILQLSSDSEETGALGTNIFTPESSNFTSYALRTGLPAGDMIPSGNNTLFSSSQQEGISVTLSEQSETLLWNQLLAGGNGVENLTNGHQISHSESSSHLSAARRFLLLDSDSTIDSPTSHLPEVEKVKYTYETGNVEKQSSMVLRKENDTNRLGYMTSATGNSTYPPDYTGMLYDESQFGMPLVTDSSLTVAQKQLFSINEISPEWAFASENTKVLCHVRSMNSLSNIAEKYMKVIITGVFLCDPSDCSWSVMFDDIEVPAEIVQEGVLRCQTPQLQSGKDQKVTLYVTSSNRESCSDRRDFEFRAGPTSFNSADTPVQPDSRKNDEELKLLLEFTNILLCRPDSLATHVEPHISLTDNPSENFTERLPVTIDWMLQELLKDKLHQWLLSKHQGDGTKCSLSKQEQGIIHVISGLGYEWALNPILHAGVGINFRDVNGWTALHWAARFGREKMVAALIVAGASAGALTDPKSQDPSGKTAASIAAAHGHKGLAGYLSEVALTSHLSSLTLEESEIYKGSAEVEAERKIESISQKSNKLHVGGTEDELSLKDSLAAVRNAAQAAARIQAAFRAHSFRERQLKGASNFSQAEFGLTQEELNAISTASKFRWSFNSIRDQKYNTAALSIQRKFRARKGRKDFLNFRNHVVKIQAHIRGHQRRKKYKEFLWAVNVLEKAMLRWRRRGVGLRGFHVEFIIEEEEDVDIVKLFRKQKVNPELDEAVSRVLSLIESPDARKQYRRMLQQAKEYCKVEPVPKDS
ncbi:hypothetical protein J5N97_007181 [Dioscorea zingiberensis]|uniref:CG-1 domain-containing protein n=1 Tax=Dioscorea zingiberensis TaxID=325984 RepID=A0A9D5DDG3_9LILI|nr:hypothetical protein J5N97_007181 [Dioscorea zingiberensis]